MNCGKDCIFYGNFLYMIIHSWNLEVRLDVALIYVSLEILMIAFPSFDICMWLQDLHSCIILSSSMP